MRVDDLSDYLRLRRVAENPFEVVRFRKNRRLGDELCVRLRGRPPLFLRAGRTEYHIFHRVFLRDEYRLAPLLARGFGTVVDLGANVGVFSAHIAPHAERVISCEPVPENCAQLDRNLSGYAHVVREHVAVSDAEKPLRIFVPRREKNSGIYTSRRAGQEHRFGDECIEVAAVSLAALLDRHGIGDVDLLKIDVEGAEYEILHAGASRLPRVKRIHGEYHDVDPDDPRTRTQNFVAWLEKQGFRVSLAPHRRYPNHGMFFAVRNGLDAAVA